MINTALCSYGMSGKVFHGPLLKASGKFNIRAIYERTKSLSKDDFPDAQIVRSYSDILENESIELIVVNTPPEYHYNMTKQALEAGKHVVVEKPFVTYTQEGQELINLAEREGLILTVFHNRRWDSPFLAAKEIIDQKLLGRIVEYEANFDRFRTGLSAKAWKETAAPGTGLLYDLGSHLIDQTCQLFGRPKQVFSKLLKQRDNSEVIDYLEVQLIYGAVKATLKARMLVNAPTPVVAIYGDKGSYQNFTTDRQEEKLVIGELPNTESWAEVPAEDWGKLYLVDESKLFPSPNGSWVTFYENVYQAIRNKKELIVKPQEALEVIENIDACYLSDREGRIVDI